MAIKVKINSKTEPVFPCFMRHKLYGGVFHFFNRGTAYCVDKGACSCWEVGDTRYRSAIDEYEQIPNPFAKPEPEYTFPILMTHKEYGGVYKFYGLTERVCIDAGMAPLVAVHRIDSDITCYELFNGEAILSNA